MRYFFIIGVLLFFVGCGPKYKVQKEYIASSSNNSSCLSSCESKKSVCNTSCDIKYDMCMKNAQKSANILHKQALREYESEKFKYDRDLKEYNDKKQRYDSLKKDLKYDIAYLGNRCKKGGTDASYVCNRYDNAKVQLDRLNAQNLSYPSYPKRPELYDILKQTQNRCSKDCGCVQNYDICFSQCGGSIKYHKICIENCD